jgi:transcriptional regulator with XRE-family HTH domain
MIENSVETSQVHRRKRGVILSPHGWQRLQAAEQQAANLDNAGKIYTLEQLSERTGLSPNTITKVRRRRLAVDRQTLEFYFNALDLTLYPEDYISLDPEAKPYSFIQQPIRGPVPLDSLFYIERPPIERLAYEEILQPGALIRIRAPRQFGKTSLMTRILATSQTKGLRGTVLNLHLADAAIFQDLSRFLRWFCAVVTHDLQLPNQVDSRWNEVYGSNYNCTDYFESYLLPELNSPLVLALDELDTIYSHPRIAADFFGLLRAWYEKSRYSNGNNIWQKLRLVTVHSTEVYLPQNINQAPFSVGLLLELPHFTLDQVQDLARRYGIEAKNEAMEVAARLTDLLGGSPYLTQLALHTLARQEASLEQFTEAGTLDRLFSAHLRQRLADVQFHPQLFEALRRVMSALEPVELHPLQAFQLQGMGLIRLVNGRAIPAYQLYRDYFTQVLSIVR